MAKTQPTKSVTKEATLAKAAKPMPSALVIRRKDREHWDFPFGFELEVNVSSPPPLRLQGSALRITGLHEENPIDLFDLDLIGVKVDEVMYTGWDTERDFRRVLAETKIAAQFLEDLSILIELQVGGTSLDPKARQEWIDTSGASPKVKPDVLERLSRGENLRLQEKFPALANDPILCFETTSITINSPLKFKIRPIIRTLEKWKREAAVATLCLLAGYGIHAAQDAVKPSAPPTAAQSYAFSPSQLIFQCNPEDFVEALAGKSFGAEEIETFKEFQQELANQGFYAGELTGLPDAKTSAAFKDWLHADDESPPASPVAENPPKPEKVNWVELILMLGTGSQTVLEIIKMALEIIAPAEDEEEPPPHPATPPQPAPAPPSNPPAARTEKKKKRKKRKKKR